VRTLQDVGVDGRHDDVWQVVTGFGDAVRRVADVSAFYVGGSLATGDYRPAVSDLDLVALVAARLTPAREAEVVALHEALLRDEPLAARLHCVYVPVPEITAVGAAHPTWAHGELYRRHLSGVARAELLRYGHAVYGAPPVELFPAVSDNELEAAVRAELTGYWTGALAKPHIWLQDVYVHLGLLTLPRAEAALREGRLITKTEALPRLAGFGVAPDLVAEIERHRLGRSVPMPLRTRRRRARHARHVMAGGIRSLTRG
jgi:hypothetical protein